MTSTISRSSITVSIPVFFSDAVCSVAHKLQTLSSIPTLCAFTFISTPPCFADTRKYSTGPLRSIHLCKQSRKCNYPSASFEYSPFQGMLRRSDSHRNEYPTLPGSCGGLGTAFQIGKLFYLPAKTHPDCAYRCCCIAFS